LNYIFIRKSKKVFFAIEIDVFYDIF
jgi:hypothetical protein